MNRLASVNGNDESHESNSSNYEGGSEDITAAGKASVLSLKRQLQHGLSRNDDQKLAHATLSSGDNNTKKVDVDVGKEQKQKQEVALAPPQQPRLLSPASVRSVLSHSYSRKRQVSFDSQLSIREHSLTVGHHPCCNQSGLALSLDWAYCERSAPLPIADHRTDDEETSIYSVVATKNHRVRRLSYSERRARLFAVLPATAAQACVRSDEIRMAMSFLHESWARQAAGEGILSPLPELELLSSDDDDDDTDNDTDCNDIDAEERDQPNDDDDIRPVKEMVITGIASEVVATVSAVVSKKKKQDFITDGDNKQTLSS